MDNLDKATFIKRAKEICLESFRAYFMENDFPKSCKNMPSDRFKSFCIDKLHTCVTYEAFMDYLMPTDCYEKSAIAENINLQVPFATEEICVVLLTADINYLIDNGYVLHFLGRTSYVVTQKQGKLEIVHLHFALPRQSIHNAQMQPQENSKILYINNISEPSQYSSGAATAAGMYSPNGLIFYQISGKAQVNLVNASLLKLLGYASNKALFAHTQGGLERLVLAEDWSRLRQELEQQQPGRIFNLNISLLHRDGSSIKVLLRGHYVENHNKFFILSATPIFVPEEQLNYGDFSEEAKYAEDYSIPYELFLKIALDIFVQYGREQGIPHLLELCTVVLNAHSSWICDVRQSSSPLKLLCNATVPGHKKLVPVNIPSRCALYFCQRYYTDVFNSLNEMPKPLASVCSLVGISSFMYRIISVKGQASFIVFFHRQQDAKPWTENEKKIMYYASKMFALLLDGYVAKQAEHGCGGAQ